MKIRLLVLAFLIPPIAISRIFGVDIGDLTYEQAKQRWWPQTELWPAERQFLSNIKRPYPTQFDTNKTDSSNSIRGSVLSFICKNPELSASISQAGVSLIGATIEGSFDIQDTKLQFPLKFRNCTFTDAVNISNADIQSFVGARCIFRKGLNGISLKCAKDFYIHSQTTFDGPLMLSHSQVNGHLILEALDFKGSSTHAVFAESAQITGSVVLRDLRSAAPLSFDNATVNGSMVVSKCNIGSQSEVSFTARRLKLSRGLLINDTIFSNIVDLTRATVSQGIDAFTTTWSLKAPEIILDSTSQFISNRFGGYIVLDQTRSRDLYFVRSTMDGLHSRKSDIDGNLTLVECDIGAPNDTSDAINIEFSKIRGQLAAFGGTTIHGKVNLRNTSTEGSWFFHGLRIVNSNSVALYAPLAEVSKLVLLQDNFLIWGSVDLTYSKLGGANIADGEIRYGTLNLTHANIDADCHFVNTVFSPQLNDRVSIEAKHAIVGGEFDVSKSFIAKTLSVAQSQIRKGLLCEEAYLNGLDAHAVEIGNSILLNPKSLAGVVDLSMSRVQHEFLWNPTITSNCTVKLRHAEFGNLRDELGKWFSIVGLDLHGCRYTRLEQHNESQLLTRLEWVKMGCGNNFNSQPYEQLASVLKASGYDEQWKTVMIAKNEQSYRNGNCPTRVFGRMYGTFAGYGYRLRGFVILGIVVWIIGYIACNVAFDCKMLKSTSGSKFPKTSWMPLLYSLDVLLPVIKLGETERWQAAIRAVEKSKWDPSPVTALLLRLTSHLQLQLRRARAFYQTKVVLGLRNHQQEKLAYIFDLLDGKVSRNCIYVVRLLDPTTPRGVRTLYAAGVFFGWLFATVMVGALTGLLKH